MSNTPNYTVLEYIRKGVDGERGKQVLKAVRPLPPFGVCTDTEVVVVKRVELPTSSSNKTDNQLYRLCLDVCLRNFFSTYPAVSAVKDYHMDGDVAVSGGGKTFSVVSEFCEGVPLSQYPPLLKEDGVGVLASPEILESQVRWVLVQMFCLVHHMALHGWNHLAFGGSWHLDNFIVDTQTGNLKLVDFGLQGATVEQLDLGDDGSPDNIIGISGLGQLVQLWFEGNVGLTSFVERNFSADGKEAVATALDGTDFVKLRTNPWLTQGGSSHSKMFDVLQESAPATEVSPLILLLLGLKQRGSGNLVIPTESNADMESPTEYFYEYLHEAAELWLFGYGSLLWKQNFEFVGRPEESYIKGYVRLFTQGSTDHRGVPGKPGRVVTLEPKAGAKVLGLMFRIAEGQKQAALTALDIREKGGYERHMMVTYPAVHRSTEKRSDESGKNKGRRVFPFPSLVYIANTENEEYLGTAPIPDLAHQIYHSVGPSGPNKDYLLNMVKALRELDMLTEDQHLTDLEAACLALEKKEEQ